MFFSLLSSLDSSAFSGYALYVAFNDGGDDDDDATVQRSTLRFLVTFSLVCSCVRPYDHTTLCVIMILNLCIYVEARLPPREREGAKSRAGLRE